MKSARVGCYALVSVGTGVASPSPRTTPNHPTPPHYTLPTPTTPTHPLNTPSLLPFFISSLQFKDHLKKAEAVSEFAKTKTIAEQRRFLPVYGVREELLQVGWGALRESVHVLVWAAAPCQCTACARSCCRWVGWGEAGWRGAGGRVCRCTCGCGLLLPAHVRRARGAAAGRVGWGSKCAGVGGWACLCGWEVGDGAAQPACCCGGRALVHIHRRVAVNCHI